MPGRVSETLRKLGKDTARRAVRGTLSREPFRSAIRAVVSEAATYDLPDRLADVARPSWARSRVISYSPHDPRVTVGRYCSLNDMSYVVTGGDHHHEHVSTCLFHFTMGAGPEVYSGDRGPIRIGNDVWTGFGSVIMSGVTVGDGAVVGAGAVVTRDIEPYAVVGGVPARLIRYRFDEGTRHALLRIRWWDWPESRVADHVEQLSGPDVRQFVAGHDPATGAPAACPACLAPRPPARAVGARSRSGGGAA
jgi:acetyltransferase-like isoleucine patch superfamily enzyme